MPPTLKDVAKRAGVSTATVSRVLNNKPSNVPISEGTRQRVLQAVKDLGYTPNFAARNLATKSSFRLVGTIFPAHVPSVLNHPFYVTVLRGVADFCQSHGYAVAVYFADLDADEPTYRRILEIPVDGFILTTTHAKDTFIPRFLEDKKTFVHIGRRFNQSEPETNFVDCDNYQGARLAVEHLVKLGHQRIATITGLPSMAAGLDRLKAYRDVLHETGLEVDPALIIEGDFDDGSGYQGMLRLLDTEPRPTAVFAASDAMAMGGMRALRERGLSVPADMAIIGYDDIPQAARTDPPLTTIRQPIFELGKAAAELLIHLLTGEGERPQTILTPKLIRRESCSAR